MVRMTVNEMAIFLGREKMWVYSALKKLGYDHVHSVLSIDQIHELYERSFKFQGYEKFIYDKIVEKKYTLILEKFENLTEIKDAVKEISKDVFCELVIAKKVLRPQTTVFNIVAHFSRRFGVNGNYEKELKDHIYRKFCKLIAKKTVGVEYLVGKTKLNEIETEACKALKEKIIEELKN